MKINIIGKIFFICFLILIFTTSIVNATNNEEDKKSTNTFSWSDIISGGDSFIDEGKDSASEVKASEMNNVSSSIYNSLLAIGIVLIVLVGVVLGIQFMIASAEDKAKIKEAALPYFAGSFVILGAFGIWKILVNILSGL